MYTSTPIVGLAIQHGISVEIGETSKFGKTEGVFQPSEASGPLTHWFGGGHPSQDVSTKILPGREDHFRATLSACEFLYDGAPLIIKNAWNCFRVSYLANALPAARFIWLKRDIKWAAASDLKARYLTKGNAMVWNSATPSNVDLLRLRPPAEQVVENQFEYNQAIGDALAAEAQGRWCDIWYEDLLVNPDDVFGKLSEFLGLELKVPLSPAKQLSLIGKKNQSAEVEAIEDFISKNSQRFRSYCYFD